MVVTVLSAVNHKRYDNDGQYGQVARLYPRRQLGQWQQCRGVHAQSEQCADEYEHEHWVSRRQELQAPPETDSIGLWPQEWRLTMVDASVHDDLPFVLSWPESDGLSLRRLNSRAGCEYEILDIFRTQRTIGLPSWTN